MLRPARIALACCPAALALAIAGPAGAAPPDAGTIQRLGDAHVARLNAAGQGLEYEIAHSASGDLDGDGRQELVLLYIGYGPTFSQTGLAVFADRGRGHALAVDAGVPLGNVEGLEVRDGEIRVASKMPGPDDPRCCPSRDVTHRFRWAGDRLEER